MAEIVNLRRVRKRKEKVAREVEAQQNRLHFGRTKAERQLTEAQEKLNTRQLDAHRLDGKPEE